MLKTDKKGVILLLSGKVTTLSKLHSFNDEQYDLIKIDEKDLINFKTLLSLIKGKGYNELLIGILNKENQRFLFFLNLISGLSFINNPYLIDEVGRKIRFGLSRLLFYSLPVFIAGIAYSAIIVPLYLIIFKTLRWKYLKTN
jgi:hypothetical protein